MKEKLKKKMIKKMRIIMRIIIKNQKAKKSKTYLLKNVLKMLRHQYKQINKIKKKKEIIFVVIPF